MVNFVLYRNGYSRAEKHFYEKFLQLHLWVWCRGRCVFYRHYGKVSDVLEMHYDSPNYYYRFLENIIKFFSFLYVIVF